MEDVNVHRRKQVGDDGATVGAVGPVARVDGVRVPVGPVQRVTEHRQSERMRKLLRVGHYLGAIAAVHVRAVDVVVFAIGPVEPAAVEVHREAVRPEDACRHDDLPGGGVAIHAGALDLGHLAPVRPEHQSTETQTHAQLQRQAVLHSSHYRAESHVLL